MISKRKSQRSRCRLRADVIYQERAFRGSVLDLSETGMRLYVNNDIEIPPGRSIDVKSQELGHLTGTVRWHRFPEMGIQLDLSSNTVAKISSFFRKSHAS